MPLRQYLHFDGRIYRARTPDEVDQAYAKRTAAGLARPGQEHRACSTCAKHPVAHAYVSLCLHRPARENPQYHPIRISCTCYGWELTAPPECETVEI